jgi:hypothetical protein
MARHQDVSSSAVQRIWKACHLQPHRIEHFKFSTDPINASQQIVGVSSPSIEINFNSRGFLWEKGDMVDWNPLIENPSGLHVWEGLYISDNGRIYAQA